MRRITATLGPGWAGGFWGPDPGHAEAPGLGALRKGGKLSNAALGRAGS
jgi:hypothetical protein